MTTPSIAFRRLYNEAQGILWTSPSPLSSSLSFESTGFLILLLLLSLCISIQMGFFVGESSGLIVTHLLYKVALIIAVARWVFCWALRLRDRWSLFSSAPDHDTEFSVPPTSTPTTSTAVASSQMIRDNLVLTTLGDLTERLPENGNWDTCAVCLNGLSKEDEIRELRNCYHVFHRECIDRWMDGAHDNNHTTCPLCRAPLLTSSQFQSLSFVSRAQPSWAVERLLYLFGDDLLFWFEKYNIP